jgi:hypothetical protein
MVKNIKRLFFLSLFFMPIYTACVSSQWSSIKSVLADGAWAVIKPFDVITNDGVIEFTPQGRVRKDMAQMKQEVAGSIPTIETSEKYAFPKKVKEILEKATNSNQNNFKKHHINVYWHGTSCVPKRAALALMHYSPTAYIATGLKWLTLTALIGTGVEEGVKFLKKLRTKGKKKEPIIEKEANQRG